MTTLVTYKGSGLDGSIEFDDPLPRDEDLLFSLLNDFVAAIEGEEKYNEINELCYTIQVVS